jgi:hypothetical protein
METISYKGYGFWTSILSGAVICLAIQFLLTLLGSGVGLLSVDVYKGLNLSTLLQIVTAFFVVLSLAISFGVGGFLSTFLGGQRTKFSALVHGLTTWAVVIVSSVFFLGTAFSSSLGGILGAAGIGTGATVGFDAFWEELRELNPRIVSDVKLMDGKIVTSLVSDKKKPALASETLEQAKRDPKLTPSVREDLKDVKNAAGGASLLAFVALLICAFSSWLGGRLAVRRMPVSEEVISAEPVRRSAA